LALFPLQRRGDLRLAQPDLGSDRPRRLPAFF
jgi:hypothetical protein